MKIEGHYCTLFASLCHLNSLWYYINLSQEIFFPFFLSQAYERTRYLKAGPDIQQMDYPDFTGSKRNYPGYPVTG